MTIEDEDFKSLSVVLERAYQRASSGKGKERHATGVRFEEQPWHDIYKHHGIGFVLGQAEKKMIEQYKLTNEERINELLDVIVYVAMGVIALGEDK
jgi:hypothetical protein